MSADRSWQRFPTDEMTLRLLISACEINPDTGHTHLHDFLQMGTEEKSRELIDEGNEELGGMAGAPVYLVEYEEGQEPHSEHTVIISLAEEILALRVRLEGAA